MTLLSHFARLHPCGISLRSTSLLSSETDIVLAKVFLFPVISKDRLKPSVTQKAQRLTGGLFIAAGVFALCVCSVPLNLRLYHKFRLVRDIGARVKDSLIRWWY